jgi:SMC interacting uncharacterized protein involved in chromosome segregation
VHTHVEHKSHAVVPISNKFEQCEEIIKNTRNEIDGGLSNAVANIQEAEELLKVIDATREELKVDIDASSAEDKATTNRIAEKS